MNIGLFLISWSGQHDNACAIARKLDRFRDNLTIVYSDSDPAFELMAQCRTIRRPDNLFWSDKFKACLDAFNGDVMLVLHSDCHCDDWPALVRRCAEGFRAFPSVGVWSPLVRGSTYEIEITEIAKVDNSPFSIVAQTDGICFAVSPAIVDRMRRARYSENVYGWSIDWMMVANAYTHSRLVLVDRSVVVQHPPQRGYSTETAKQQGEVFLRQLKLPELIQYRLLSVFVEARQFHLASRGAAGQTAKTSSVPPAADR